MSVARTERRTRGELSRVLVVDDEADMRESVSQWMQLSGFEPRTFDGAELALSVLFESGQQHFGGAIEKYRERPRLERFLEQVPAAWDETRLLWGYPGAGLVLARRRGERWFLGGLAATPLPPVKVSLGFLKGAWRVEIIRDGEGGLVSETHRLDSAGEDADSGRCLTVPLNPGSGFAGVATPLK